MSTPTREQVYQAFFNIVSNPPPTVLAAQAAGPSVPTNPVKFFKTVSRRLRSYDNVEVQDQPALFVRELNEEVVTNDTGKPNKYYMHLEVYVYVNVGNDNELIPSTLLNQAIDNVMNSLKPTMGERQTLGGLVYNCRISGKIEIFDGPISSGQAAAIIPAQILTADL